MPLTRKLAAEFIGTFWLVLGGCGSGGPVFMQRPSALILGSLERTDSRLEAVGRRALSQHSQLGRNCRIGFPQSSMVRARTREPSIVNSPKEMGKLKRRGPQLPGLR
jgi:hypothetical protein